MQFYVLLEFSPLTYSSLKVFDGIASNIVLSMLNFQKLDLFQYQMNSIILSFFLNNFLIYRYFQQIFSHFFCLTCVLFEKSGSTMVFIIFENIPIILGHSEIKLLRMN